MRIRLIWRILALFAAVLYALLVFGVLYVVAHNLGLALIVGIAFGLLLVAAWLMFTGSGERRRKGQALMALGSTLSVIAVLVFIREVSQPRLVIGFLIVAATYLLLITVLRKAYWRELRQYNLSTNPTTAARFERPYLIINPKSGNGRAVKAHIESLATKKHIKVLVMQKGDDVEALAHRAADAGADVLGISGGDGSIGAVVKVALERELPVVVLPGGTRCHFARDAGLDPNRLADALEGFTGIERKIDVGSINGRIFLNNVSLGLYADIVDHPEYRDHKLEVIRRVVGEVVNGTKKPYELHFSSKIKNFDSAVQVLIGVNQYQTMNLLELGERDRLDGGVLQVTAITRLDDEALRHIITQSNPAKLSHGEQSEIQSEDLYQWLTDEFTVSSPTRSLVVGVDGERETYSSPVTIKIIPGALRMFVPAEGVRSRPVKAFSLRGARYAWQAGVHAHTGP